MTLDIELHFVSSQKVAVSTVSVQENLMSRDR